MNDAALSIAALLELVELPRDESKARGIVAGLASPQKLKLFDRIAATARARKMLDDGLERRAVAYRLVARYDVSLKSAYRRITEAVDLGRPAFGTAPPGR